MTVDATWMEAPVVLGAGPVGRAVAAELSRRGRPPTVVTRSGTPVPGATAVAGDVTDAAGLAALLRDRGAGVVFQCAQPDYHRWPAEFPALQAAVVDASAAVGARLVVVENLYGYGPHDGPLTERTPLAATTRKGRVRAEMWRALRAAHEEGRVAALAVRASDFFGPGVTGSAFGERFVDPLLAGRPAEIYGPPEHRHSITYVPDLASAMVELATHDRAYGAAWHAPNEPPISIDELVRQIATAAGTTPRVRRLRPWQLRLAGLFVPAARESVEMLYEFDDDLVVDDSAGRAEFGLGSTPREHQIAETVAAHRAAAGVDAARAS